LTEDIHEPLESYNAFLKDAHARNTAAFFEDLLKTSGIDEAANIQCVKALRKLEKKVANASSSSNNWQTLRWVTLALLVIAVLYVWSEYSSWWLIGLAVIFGPAILKLNQIIAEVNSRLAEAERERDAKLNEAWLQMEPLNQLYDWDISAKLIEQTVPRIKLDPYFSNGRLAELRDSFGLNNQFNHQDQSILFSHSGVLNGNPFVLANVQKHWMGQKTYHGSLNISWTEWVTDSRGNRTLVTRHQTLHASVSKPFPEYGKRTFIIYGNEAAPDLSFSRSPSELSKLEDGMINNWKKRRAEKALEKKSRDLENNFTVMSNREFDTLFAAIDRDHEVQFRLLFTPLAQQEMVKLLKDKEIGYGDNFNFLKRNMLNMVEPDHMMSIDISGDPKMFHAYELTQARKFFNDYHNNLFKSLFFGIAPILTIPLYQQHRSHADIYKDVYTKKSCFWEHEAIANYFGEHHFQHPHCITQSILKTESKVESDGSQTVCVRALGYKGEGRRDYVSVYGGDGHMHKVPVDWVEYLDVARESNMVVKENIAEDHQDTEKSKGNEDWHSLFQHKGIHPANVLLRRSILSALVPND
jgi:hypothetical protein